MLIRELRKRSSTFSSQSHMNNNTEDISSTQKSTESDAPSTQIANEFATQIASEFHATQLGDSASEGYVSTLSHQN